MPLIPGMFVDVDIVGRAVNNVMRIPPHALRQGNEVWVAEDDKLRIKQVTVVRKTPEAVYISEGLPETATIVTSPLDAVADGMTIRTYDADMQGKSDEMVHARDGSENP